MKKILLFADWYEPGYRAGGPIRSCVNFTGHLKEDHEIYILTSDRDHGSPDPYENVETDNWQQKEDRVWICYCSPRRLTLIWLREQINTISPDYIYLNSIFSRYFTIYPLLIVGRGQIPAKIVLSPRGMLRESALNFKPLKKKFFLALFRLLGWHRHIHFLAADETECKDVLRHFSNAAQITQIPNLPGILADDLPGLCKMPGELSMIFVGRIHPIKNLDYLLRVLECVNASVRLTVIGSLEDKVFWEKCRTIIEHLPSNIIVTYLGEKPNHYLPAIIREHHIFALPTKGENYGHAIYEALSLKKPVLISDQTPWRSLRSEKAGWDIALQAPGEFEAAILEAAAWDQDDYNKWAEGAFNFARKHVDNSNALEKYKKLFS